MKSLTFSKLDSELIVSNLKSMKFNDKLTSDNVAENYKNSYIQQ